MKESILEEMLKEHNEDQVGFIFSILNKVKNIENVLFVSFLVESFLIDVIVFEI